MWSLRKYIYRATQCHLSWSTLTISCIEWGTYESGPSEAKTSWLPPGAWLQYSSEIFPKTDPCGFSLFLSHWCSFFWAKLMSWLTAEAEPHLDWARSSASSPLLDPNLKTLSPNDCHSHILSGYIMYNGEDISACHPSLCQWFPHTEILQVAF